MGKKSRKTDSRIKCKAKSRTFYKDSGCLDKDSIEELPHCPTLKKLIGEWRTIKRKE